MSVVKSYCDILYSSLIKKYPAGRPWRNRIRIKEGIPALIASGRTTVWINNHTENPKNLNPYRLNPAITYGFSITKTVINTLFL